MWAEDEIQQFLQGVQELMAQHYMSIIGMMELAEGPDHVQKEMERVRANSGLGDLEMEILRERAVIEKDVLVEQLKRRFPILNEQATTALWGALESFVDGFRGKMAEKPAGGPECRPA